MDFRFVLHSSHRAPYSDARVDPSLLPSIPPSAAGRLQRYSRPLLASLPCMTPLAFSPHLLVCLPHSQLVGPLSLLFQSQSI